MAKEPRNRFLDDGKGIEIVSHPDPEIEKRVKTNVEKAKQDEQNTD